MFKQRSTRPEKSNKFYIRTSSGGYSECIFGKPMDLYSNVLPNCVGYACGRFNEVYSELTDFKRMKFPLLNCNAEDFPERAKKYYKALKFTKTGPRPGDIMVWRKGKTATSSDGVGHVAFVERVNNDGTLTITESGYNSFVWRTAIINNNNGRWNMSSAYTFRGFLHNPAVTDEMIKEWNEKHPKQSYPGVLPTGMVSNTVGTPYQVKLWQKFLNWYDKNYRLDVDGIFGTDTIAATKDFQKDNKLKVDGIAGTNTLIMAKKVKK